MRTDEVDAVTRELELYGIRPTVEHRSKHQEVLWEYNGHKGSQIVPASGSDVRGWLNARGDVRRWLRAHNAVIPQNIRPPVLQKALQLPSQADTALGRFKHLEQNLDALLDLVGDVAAKNVELSSELASLKAKFNNIKVTATVTFEEPVAQAAAPVLSLVEHKAAVRSTDSASGSAAVLAALKEGRWRTRHEIADALGVTPIRVSQTLNYLSTKRLVENGLRGMWRKVVVAETTLLGAALTEAVLNKEQREGSS